MTHMQSSGSSYHVMFENERVRVFECVEHPGEHMSAPTDHESMMLCLDECHMRLNDGGRSEDVQLHPGDVRWLETAIADFENLGPNDARMLFVEFKTGGMYDTTTTAADLGALSEDERERRMGHRWPGDRSETQGTSPDMGPMGGTPGHPKHITN